MTLDAATLAPLAACLATPLRVVDAGCRWGAADIWTALGDAVEVIGFDPDAKECARLAAAAGSARRRYVPLGLGARTGPATLCLTAEPACASLYPPDARAARERPELAVIAPRGRATVAVTRLDEWLVAEGIGDVDVVKLDVQGAELDVIEGAGAVLDRVRAIETEVVFNPIYTGQPLFADVDRALRQRGFVLWRLSNLVHYGLADAGSAFARPEHHWFDSRPVAVAAQGGQLYWADAFYVPEAVAFEGAARAWSEWVRDALVAGALGFADLAARALTRARDGAPADVRDVFPHEMERFGAPAADTSTAGTGRWG